MKCIYCNNESDLTVSDIIPYALTGAKLKKRFVCKEHNGFTNDNYENQMIRQLDVFRNRLGLTERDGDPVRYKAELSIGEYTFPNVSISDHASIMDNSKRLFRTTDENGKTILVGNRSELLKIKGATDDKIKDIGASDFSAVSHTNIQNLFISAATLHAIAKIAYEWHCFINDIESFDSQKYSDIVSYILNPEAQDHPVDLVIDAMTWALMDQFSQTGSNMLFEYCDIDGNTYVIFGFWGVIIYKVRICKNDNVQFIDANIYNSYFYHVDGTDSGAIFAIHGKPKVLSENCDQALSRLCGEIKNRLSKLGERDITKKYIANHIKTIEDLLPKYKSGTCSIAQLLDFEHEDRVVPVHIIEQLSCNSQNYDTSETFTQNMQRILDCKDKFIFTKDKLKEVLQRYVDMDKSGTFADVIENAIAFFRSI